ncbi:MAG: hypothetical protein FWG42_10305 [Clostridiales bacterium]|nr:hypothetical protein [Clostridiales bacterium]
MYFIGAAIVLLGLPAACYIKGIPGTLFLNPAAIITVLLTVIGLIVATSSYKTFICGLNAVLSPKLPTSGEERENAACLFKLLSRGVVLTSIVPLFISLIVGFANFDDMYYVFHAFASALTSPILGIMVSIAFFEPAVCVLRKPRSEPETQTDVS